MSGVSVTLYRFRIDLSDIERGVYEQLDFRVAQHPSESLPFLLTRAFAYALNWQEGLEFSPKGLGDPDEPAILATHPGGRRMLWIEIGNPSPRKLHKASKACPVVKVYTYKDPELILKEAAGEDIHRAGEIEITAFGPAFLDRIAKDIGKDMRLTMLVNDGTLTITHGERSEETAIRRLRLA